MYIYDDDDQFLSLHFIYIYIYTYIFGMKSSIIMVPAKISTKKVLWQISQSDCEISSNCGKK